MNVRTYTCIVHLGYGLSVANAITVCQAFIMNSDGRREARLRRRERRAAESSVEREMRLARPRVANRARYARAAESSEQRETRLGRCRVADRARYAADSDGRTERRRERHAAESWTRD